MNGKNRNWKYALMLGATAAAGAIWLVWRKSSASQEAKLSPIWRRALASRYGPEKVKRIEKAMQSQYSDLLAGYSMPENRFLQMHVRNNILPGIALYRVLLEDCEDQRQALAEIDKIFQAWALERSGRLLAPLKVLPVSFGFFKWAAMLQMKIYPAEGWDVEYVENSDTGLAFNMKRCFYLNTLTTLGAPELTASFCKTDEVMAELFPANIRFVRPHTLGRGDTLCDFRYCLEAKTANLLPAGQVINEGD